MTKGWAPLSTEYMYSKLNEIIMNKFANDEITEEEYERLDDKLQLMGPAAIRKKYENMKRIKNAKSS